MTKKKRMVIIILSVVLCSVIVTAYYGLFDKPPKEDLVPAIREAFAYYRSGGVGNPPAYVYYLENPEKYVHYEPLPAGLTIPDAITSESFTLKRPSRDVIACVSFDGYTAYCTLKYLDPYFMESFPPAAWQVVTVEFVKNK